MSCCGKKREQYVESFSHAHTSLPENGRIPAGEDLYFEYTGRTALTIRGSVTGGTYRFHSNGDRQVVDRRDAGGMMGLDILRKVRL